MFSSSPESKPHSFEALLTNGKTGRQVLSRDEVGNFPLTNSFLEPQELFASETANGRSRTGGVAGQLGQGEAVE